VTTMSRGQIIKFILGISRGTEICIHVLYARNLNKLYPFHQYNDYVRK